MRVLDVGCGPGIYVDALRRLGVEADGIDPDPRCPHTHMSVFDDAFGQYANQYDLCLCLEVAEHIPAHLANDLVARLVSVAPVVVFSAAQPGQGGHGHINCQPPDYWAYKFACHNYVLDSRAREDLCAFMRAGYHLGWLTNNVQVFRRYGDVCFDQIIAEETPQAERLAACLKQQFTPAG